MKYRKTLLGQQNLVTCSSLPNTPGARYLGCRQNQQIIKELSTPPHGSQDLFFDKPYARTFVTQFSACFWKHFWSYWRNPSYNGVRFLTTIIMGLLFGTLFWNKGKQTYVSTPIPIDGPAIDGIKTLSYEYICMYVCMYVGRYVCIEHRIRCIEFKHS